ncbi:hypothetical protein CV102_11080 [Natronococcus pandeyae]|uniref:DUF5305 domain-containing protein n=1 Tax=Natronococcus pandeyae TaxID=2055836 RepID=A0A8J8Q0V8_9EURY|nr:DUF5305 domain-containing protein [Natronococcus pandeyae]TYL38351.1 hypothetical protein CV102_11080 [Natronococcus pandeyae]
MIENPRLDLLIAEHGRTLTIVLVGIGLLALLATGWVAATPATSTTTQEVDQESIATETTTSAIVVEDGPWEEGTELEDSPVYVLSATPELTLTPETSVPTDETSVTHEVQVHHEAERDGSVFWDETEQQSRMSASVEDGVASSEATIDVEAVRDRQTELQEEFDGVGTIRTVVQVVVEYETGTYSGEQVLVTSLQTTEEAYWLEESLADSTEHSQTAQMEVQESPNTAVIGGLSLVAAIALAGAAVVVTRGPIDVDTARRSIHEHRYAEWISRGSIPMWVGDYHVALDSLEDVVDVAIDTNERVVHDEQRGLFAVVNGEVVYYYAERGQWEQTAWPELELGTQSAVDDEVDEPPTVPTPREDLSEDLPDPDDDDAWDQI